LILAKFFRHFFQKKLLTMAEKTVDNVLYHLIFNRIQIFDFSEKIFDFCQKAVATIKKLRP